MQQRDSKGLLRSPLQVHAEGLPQYALCRLLRALYPRRAYYKNPSTAAGRRYIKSTMSYNGNLEQDLARLAPPSPQEGEGWEEEFDEKAEKSFAEGGFITTDFGGDWQVDMSSIKKFIRFILASRDAALMGEIKFIEEGIQACKDDSAQEDCSGNELHYIHGKSQALKIMRDRLAAIALVGSKQKKK